MFPSYRNQSVDLLCKSTDWFLYDRTLAVKGLNKFIDVKVAILLDLLLELHKSF